MAVVLGCLKFGTPDLKVARWLRRADPDPIRGHACSWFYVVLAIMRIGCMAVLVIFVLFAFMGLGMPQGQLLKQLMSAVLVILACYAGAALASWIAVASALRHGVRLWMDATTKAAVRDRLWPPLVPERSRRAGIGPGLIAAYAVFTGLSTTIGAIMIAVGLTAGLGAATIVTGLFVVVCATIGFFLIPSVLARLEATHPMQCYPEILVAADQAFDSDSSDPTDPDD